MAPADSVGQQLKRQRESLELSLDEVAESTKIRAWYLEALEEDNRERLPADVYALGFLRAYARHLGLDATDVVDRWRAQSRHGAAEVSAPVAPVAPPARQEKPAPARERPPRRPPAASGPSAHAGSPPRSSGWWVVAMLLGVVLVGIVLVVLNRGAPHPTAAPPKHHATAPVKRRAHKTHTPPATHHQPSTSGGSGTGSTQGVVRVSQTASVTTYRARQAPVTLQLSFANPCWVEVWVNGTTSNPYGHVYQPGQSLTLTGSSSVEVRLGHPGGTTVVANGQTIPPLGTNATDLLVNTGS